MRPTVSASTDPAPAFTRDRRLPDGVGTALEWLGVALLALYFADFAARRVASQGDLKTYLFAGRAALQGLDPYRPGALSALAGHSVLPFVYPPLMLVPCTAAAMLPPQLVAVTWLGARLALLAMLVLAWRRWLPAGASLLALALVATFGWNGSAQWDLTTGNVAIVECALIWSAFAAFARGRHAMFATLVVAAACAKLVPAALLALLLVPTARAAASPRRFAAALGALAVLVLAPVFVGPAAHDTRFWSVIPDAADMGRANPSALALAAWACRLAGLAAPLAGRVTVALGALYAAGLLAFSAPVLREAYRRRDARHWVMTAAFLYVLLAPRPMAYGFVVLTPAPFYFLPRPFHRPGGALLLALLLSVQGLAHLTSIGTGSPLVTFAPLLLTLCVWALVVREHSEAALRPAADSVTGPALAESPSRAA
jgi:hypothetical protein